MGRSTHEIDWEGVERHYRLGRHTIDKLAASYYTGNMGAEESELHRLFASSHVRGEWFELSIDQVEHAARRASNGVGYGA